MIWPHHRRCYNSPGPVSGIIGTLTTLAIIIGAGTVTSFPLVSKQSCPRLWMNFSKPILVFHWRKQTHSACFGWPSGPADGSQSRSRETGTSTTAVHLVVLHSSTVSQLISVSIKWLQFFFWSCDWWLRHAVYACWHVAGREPYGPHRRYTDTSSFGVCEPSNVIFNDNT